MDPSVKLAFDEILRRFDAQVLRCGVTALGVGEGVLLRAEQHAAADRGARGLLRGPVRSHSGGRELGSFH